MNSRSMLARNGCRRKRENLEVHKELLSTLGIILTCSKSLNLIILILTFYSNGAIAALAGSQFDSSSPSLQLSLGE